MSSPISPDVNPSRDLYSEIIKAEEFSSALFDLLQRDQVEQLFGELAKVESTDLATASVVIPRIVDLANFFNFQPEIIEALVKHWLDACQPTQTNSENDSIEKILGFGHPKQNSIPAKDAADDYSKFTGQKNQLITYNANPGQIAAFITSHLGLIEAEQFKVALKGVTQTNYQTGFPVDGTIDSDVHTALETIFEFCSDFPELWKKEAARLSLNSETITKLFNSALHRANLKSLETITRMNELSGFISPEDFSQLIFGYLSHFQRFTNSGNAGIMFSRWRSEDFESWVKFLIKHKIDVSAPPALQVIIYQAQRVAEEQELYRKKPAPDRETTNSSSDKSDKTRSKA